MNGYPRVGSQIEHLMMEGNARKAVERGTFYGSTGGFLLAVTNHKPSSVALSRSRVRSLGVSLGPLLRKQSANDRLALIRYPSHLDGKPQRRICPDAAEKLEHLSKGIEGLN